MLFADVQLCEIASILDTELPRSQLEGGGGRANAGCFQ